MADATNQSTPAHDGRARVRENGTVDTGGKPAFVWCEDEQTRHRFDLPHRALPKRGIKVVEGYPLNYKRFARRAKTRIELAADPDVTDVQAEVPAGEQTPPEPAVGGDQAQAQAAAAPVESGAPETGMSGDQQHQDTAEQGGGAPVDQPATSDETPAGDDAKAATTKTRRTAR